MLQKNYPQQVGDYIIKVKSGQSLGQWNNFSVCRLQISVGQEYHEGQKLEAVANWCSPRFDKVMVCVNDTLQRFNMMFEEGLSEQEAFLKSQQLGRDWIDRNIDKFSSVRHLELKRWESWKQEVDYSDVFKKIQNLYVGNNSFRYVVDETIDDIWNRREKKKPERYCLSSRDEFNELSRRYLLEEIAIFSYMYEQQEGIDIYPGSLLPVFNIFHGKHLDGAPKGLSKRNFCRIDFSHNKSHLRLVN